MSHITGGLRSIKTNLEGIATTTIYIVPIGQLEATVSHPASVVWTNYQTKSEFFRVADKNRL